MKTKNKKARPAPPADCVFVVDGHKYRFSAHMWSAPDAGGRCYCLHCNASKTVTMEGRQ